MFFSSPSSPNRAQDVSFPSSVRSVFVAGWGEEQFFVSRRIQRLVESSSRATVPNKYLFESLRGEAIFMDQTPGVEQSAELGSGILLRVNEAVDPTVLAREFTQGINERLELIRVFCVDTRQEVDAISLLKLFPRTSTVPGVLIPGGNWLERPLPFPLINVSAEAMSNIRHIFAYGTLRHDDTSGASWTEPFNEDMDSEPAIVRGISLYLQAFPIVLIPRREDHPNEGVIGCCVTCSNDELFSQKLSLTDRIEGSPALYRRGVVRAETRTGKKVLSFIYYRSFQQIGGDEYRFMRSRIESGNFLRRGAPFEFTTTNTNL
jgi:gamma-glutamylcyclotransferase (GGCT)/AIG2-like uncharacterized protein YtfP